MKLYIFFIQDFILNLFNLSFNFNVSIIGSVLISLKHILDSCHFLPQKFGKYAPFSSAMRPLFVSDSDI